MPTLAELASLLVGDAGRDANSRRVGISLGRGGWQRCQLSQSWHLSWSRKPAEMPTLAELASLLVGEAGRPGFLFLSARIGYNRRAETVAQR
jgi:hypothetical protein